MARQVFPVAKAMVTSCMGAGKGTGMFLDMRTATIISLSATQAISLQLDTHTGAGEACRNTANKCRTGEKTQMAENVAAALLHRSDESAEAVV